MTAAAEIEILIRAKYPILYVVSWEERRVEDAIGALSKGLNRTLHTWTLTQGVKPVVPRSNPSSKPGVLPGELEASLEASLETSLETVNERRAFSGEMWEEAEALEE